MDNVKSVVYETLACLALADMAPSGSIGRLGLDRALSIHHSYEYRENVQRLCILYILLRRQWPID